MCYHYGHEKSKNFRERERELKANIFERIISSENLALSWKEFKKGKTKKADVRQFAKTAENALLQLHNELKSRTYVHAPYYAFYIQDPKLRHIHKATVRDRVLHHAIFRVLYPIFDRTFIFDSYSCRNGKGTHRAVRRAHDFAMKVSNNNSCNCWVLKCDIKKFFDSIDQSILLRLIAKNVADENALWLIGKVLESFPKGLPLGNITSQLFANIYLHELDQFAKHVLKAKYYIRYCDDFVILHKDRVYVMNMIPKIQFFLGQRLNMSLHPNKIIIRKYRQGADFLGYVNFPHHRMMRPKTKSRMMKRLAVKLANREYGTVSEESFNQTLQSYFGALNHRNSYKIKRKIEELLS